MKNKVMKRAAAVLSAVMITALTACGSKTPEEVFNEASAKSAEMKDMDMTMTMDMTMAQDSESVDMNMGMDMKVSGMNTEAMVYAAEGSVSIAAGGLEQSVDTATYYKDGYCYMETMGQKFKYVMDLDEMVETVAQSNVTTGMSSEDMQELSMEKDGDNKVLTFVADPVKISDSMQEAMGLMENQLGADDMDIVLTEVKGTCVVNKEGYFTNMDLSMGFEMDMQGITLNVTADMTAEINNPGQPVEVVIPDVEGFEEIDPAYMNK